MSKTYKIFASQVSGKQPKLISDDQKTILKGFGQKQQRFYQHINSLPMHAPAYKLNYFIPKFEGVISLEAIPIIQSDQTVQDLATVTWLEHLKSRYEIRNPSNKFLLLENIIHKYKMPNIIDIKVGVRQDSKAIKQGKMLSKDYFKMNGSRMTINTSSNGQQDKLETLFFSKYFYKNIKTDEQVINHLALYFFDGQQVRVKLLNKVIDKLRQFIIEFKTLLGCNFHSTSICIFYDSFNDDLFEIKLIDFARTNFNNKSIPDMESILGLENLHKHLMRIQKQSQIHEKTLVQLTNKYINQKVLIIPDHKVRQYEEGESRQNSILNSPQKIRMNDVQEKSEIVEN